MDESILLTLQIIDKNNQVIEEATSFNEVKLLCHKPFEQGNMIVLLASEKKQYVINFDKRIESALIFLDNGILKYPIPFEEERLAYHPDVFTSRCPVITARLVLQEEITGYRNLSTNPLDRRGETAYYPHCTATIETRDESVFAARNTIDGIIENSSHGEWPYQSWGDDEDPNAEIKIEFGRKVMADKIKIFLRADFPHDNYWKQVTLIFSDNSEITTSLRKTKEGQVVSFEPKCISWVKLAHLIKDESDESPFPALSQWEVYGIEI